ncbi:MAG TPA: ABC transporter permease [Gammaproteobacteria bacterium]|jgi:putative ABC transport system permease protein|nr:ABC transporter permease [Gammaproteobacteria bacterium]
MFSYYLNLALRSLKRNPALTVLMIMTIAFGVGASMTTFSVFRAVSGDPIPWKSSRLFIPQIDSWGPHGRSKNSNEPPDALDYIDAVALTQAQRGVLQSALYEISPSVVPPQGNRHPINVSGHAVYSEFFPMVDAPFRYGSGWNDADDDRRAQVVVISDKLNRKIFGDVNSVGKTLEIEGRPYQVVGVLADWNPQPRFYDVVNTGGFSTDRDDVFLPFQTAIAASIPNNGNTNCDQTPSEPGFVGLQHSSCVWTEFMVELDTAAQVTAYRQFLDNYAREQQQAGRYNWPPNNRLRDIPAFLEFEHVVPPDTRISLLVAFGLLIVCLVNTVGLLLAKFLRRAPEIGIRRALGASKREIYTQFLIEASMVGLAGGIVGVVLTGIGVASVGWVLPRDIANLARLDISLLLLTLVVAVATAMLAGLYPTFRASQVQPAWQLKSN